MADSANTTIEALLQERTRYEQWLARLDGSSNAAPEAVRHKIRADYQNRLDAVMDQLRGFGSSIAADLARQRAELAQLEAEQTTAQEALAEAQLRHAVGEYEPGEWQRISGEANGTIERLANRISVIQLEIHRLDEVQQLIAPRPAAAAPPAPRKPAPAPAAAAPTAPAPAVAAPAAAANPTPVPGAPRFVPRGAPSQGGSAAPRAAATPRPADGPPVDELAFLKSVTGEEERRTPSGRRSNEGMARPIESPVSGLPEVPATVPDATYVQPAPVPPPPPTVSTPPAGAAPAPAPGGTGAAKTLKCGECGTLNRPTEWYCERCGAELAAL